MLGSLHPGISGVHSVPRWLGKHTLPVIIILAPCQENHGLKNRV